MNAPPVQAPHRRIVCDLPVAETLAFANSVRHGVRFVLPGDVPWDAVAAFVLRTRPHLDHRLTMLVDRGGVTLKFPPYDLPGPR